MGMSPRNVWGAYALASIAVVFAALTFGMGWRPLWAYLASVNVMALSIYWMDKRFAAAGLRRIPEAVLHTLHILGGAPGALVAQLVLRHKTQKASFRRWFWAIFILQLIALAVWLALR